MNSNASLGLKSPTLDKLEEIAGVLEVHPAALILMAYSIEAQQPERGNMIDVLASEAKRLSIDIA